MTAGEERTSLRLGEGEGIRPVERLSGVSRELRQADSVGSAARIALDAIDRHTHTDGTVGCVRVYDPDADELAIAALTDAAERVREQRRAVDFDLTGAGRAFRRRELIRNVSGDASEETDQPRSTVHVPLGDHGTLTLCSPEGDGLSDRTVSFVDAVAAALTTALDSVETERAAQERERTLQNNRERTDALTGVVGVINGVLGSTADAETSADIYRTGCRQLAGADHWQYAWVGTGETSLDGVTVEASSGIDDQRREAIETVPVGDIAGGAYREAIETGTVQSGPGGDVASPTDGGRVCAVPIGYADREIAVLVAGRDEPAGVAVERTLGALGNAIGVAVTTLRNTELLLADDRIELEFHVADPGCTSVALSDALDCHCSIGHAVMNGDNHHVCYFRLAGVDAGRASEVVFDEREDGPGNVVTLQLRGTVDPERPTPV